MKIYSVKSVVRCRDMDASRRFYKDLLGLPVVEECEKAEGKGCTLTPGGHGGFIELSQVRPLLAPSPFRSSSKVAFAKPFATDKIDLQFPAFSCEPWCI